MCPKRFSEDACTLNAQGAKRAQVTTLEVDQGGETHCSTAMAPAWIEISRSLTYRQADAQLDKGEPTLAAMHACALALRRRRTQDGAIILKSSSDTPIDADSKGLPVISARKTRDVSENIIEEAMVAANQANAQWLSSTRATGAIDRIHAPPAPNAEHDRRLREEATAFGLQIPEGKINATWLSELIETNPVEQEAAETIARWAMTKALYSEKTAPHCGLGLAQYAHTTSPIRRYADLRCQQAARAAQGLADAIASDQGRLPDHLNTCERRAVTAVEQRRFKMAAKHRLRRRPNGVDRGPRNLIPLTQRCLRTVGVLSCHRRCGTLNLLGSRQVGALEYGH